MTLHTLRNTSAALLALAAALPAAAQQTSGSATATSYADAPLRPAVHYLWPHDFMADPSVHCFGGRLYIYPSHDWRSSVTTRANGEHYDMRDYHVFSTEDPTAGEVTDHGVVLSLEQVPWASRQLWDCDVACRNGKYYMYFPAKDRNDIFRIGVAVADNPYGPFRPEEDPMKGSYSIDPAVFEDDGVYYLYFGGLQGGQLQRYRDNRAQECGSIPAPGEEALPGRVARLADDMLEFAEAPRAVTILDETGAPLRSDDPRRFFEASWMHKRDGVYYFSYSTGGHHTICYATGDNPYGPFTYRGVVLTPVVGWTTHHAIVEYGGRWWLFFHDSAPSGGISSLRSMKVCELEYAPDGSIRTIDGKTGIE